MLLFQGPDWSWATMGRRRRNQRSLITSATPITFLIVDELRPIKFYFNYNDFSVYIRCHVYINGKLHNHITHVSTLIQQMLAGNFM